MFIIYVCAPSLSYITWDLQSSLRHVGSLVSAYRLFLKIDYFSMAALVLRCCARTFSSCCWQGLLFSCCAPASPDGGLSCCRAHALGPFGLRGWGPRAYLFHSMWGLPGPGVEPMFPALGGGFLTTGWSGKSCVNSLFTACGI